MNLQTARNIERNINATADAYTFARRTLSDAMRAVNIARRDCDDIAAENAAHGLRAANRDVNHARARYTAALLHAEMTRAALA